MARLARRVHGARGVVVAAEPREDLREAERGRCARGVGLRGGLVLRQRLLELLGLLQRLGVLEVACEGGRAERERGDEDGETLWGHRGPPDGVRAARGS
jgi:hypothetical protein